MNKESRYPTAFITDCGPYEWEGTPLVLMDAPAVFQRFIKNCLGDYRGQFARPYLDEVLVHSKNFEDHITHLKLILQQFRERKLN